MTFDLSLLKNSDSLFFIAGPCVIEDEKMVIETGEELRKISRECNIPIIFKASYDKANRTSIHSYRGPGIEKGLPILEKVKALTGLPILSDIHHPEEADQVKDVLDIIQIPAFLCRQTDLVVAAARTGKGVNIKKGQFLSPYEMIHIIQKIESTGNTNIFLTERGTFFGYNNLVVDMRSIPVMKSYGYPVIYDATHSVQLPGGAGNASGGQREFILPLARAAVAAGCDGIFMEVHPDPQKALSDRYTQIPLQEVRDIVRILANLKKALREAQ